MSNMIRIRDLTTGDEHDVPADCAAYRVARRDVTSRTTTAVDDMRGMGDTGAGQLSVGEWAYIESEDDGDAPQAVRYWLSERVA